MSMCCVAACLNLSLSIAKRQHDLILQLPLLLKTYECVISTHKSQKMYSLHPMEKVEIYIYFFSPCFDTGLDASQLFFKGILKGLWQDKMLNFSLVQYDFLLQGLHYCLCFDTIKYKILSPFPVWSFSIWQNKSRRYWHIVRRLFVFWRLLSVQCRHKTNIQMPRQGGIIDCPVTSCAAHL